MVLIEKKLTPPKLFLLGHSTGLLVNLDVVKYGDVDGIISSAVRTYCVKQVRVLRYIGYKWFSFITVKSPFNPGDLSRIMEVEE